MLRPWGATRDSRRFAVLVSAAPRVVMPPAFCRAVLLHLCVLMLALLSGARAAAAPIVINTRPGWPLQDDGDGVCERLLLEMGRRADVEVQLQVLPEERAIRNASAGLDDGDGPRIREMDTIYPGLIRVDEPLLRFDFTIFVRADGPQPQTFDELRQLDVGVIRGWKILENRLSSARSLTRVRTGSLLLGMLTAERIDAAVWERTLGLGEAERGGFEGVEAVRPALISREMFLFLNERHALLAPRLAAALRSMKDDGAYDAIFEDVVGPGSPMRARAPERPAAPARGGGTDG